MAVGREVLGPRDEVDLGTEMIEKTEDNRINRTQRFNKDGEEYGRRVRNE